MIKVMLKGWKRQWKKEGKRDLTRLTHYGKMGTANIAG